MATSDKVSLSLENHLDVKDHMLDIWYLSCLDIGLDSKVWSKICRSWLRSKFTLTPVAVIPGSGSSHSGYDKINTQTFHMLVVIERVNCTKATAKQASALTNIVPSASRSTEETSHVGRIGSAAYTSDIMTETSQFTTPLRASRLGG